MGAAQLKDDGAKNAFSVQRTLRPPPKRTRTTDAAGMVDASDGAQIIIQFHDPEGPTTAAPICRGEE